MTPGGGRPADGVPRRAHRRGRRRGEPGPRHEPGCWASSGWGTGAGTVVVGVDAVRKELQAGKCWCVVVAEDASPRAVDKVVRLAAAKGVPLVTGPARRRDRRAAGKAAGDGGRRTGPRVGRRHGAAGARTLPDGGIEWSRRECTISRRSSASPLSSCSSMLKDMNIFVRSHMSALESDQVSAVRVRWEREKRKSAEEPAAKKGRRKAVKARARAGAGRGQAHQAPPHRGRSGPGRGPGPGGEGGRAGRARAGAPDRPSSRSRRRPRSLEERARALFKDLPAAPGGAGRRPSAADDAPRNRSPRSRVDAAAAAPPRAPRAPTRAPFIPPRIQRPPPRRRAGPSRSSAAAPRRAVPARRSGRPGAPAVPAQRRPAGPQPSDPTPRRAAAGRRARRASARRWIRMRCRRTSCKTLQGMKGRRGRKGAPRRRAVVPRASRPAGWPRSGSGRRPGSGSTSSSRCPSSPAR